MAKEKKQFTELSDDDLEKVTGGAIGVILAECKVKNLKFPPVCNVV